MGVELDRLFYTIGINNEEFNQATAQTEQRFGTLVQTISGLAGTLAAGFGLTKVIQEIAGAANEYDTAMRQVWTMTDMTESEFDTLKKDVLELSSTMPYAGTEMAKALYQAYSAGVKVSDGLDFIKLASKGAIAGASDLFTAVDGLTTVQNAWGLSTEEMGSKLDTIFYTIQKGKTTFSELSNGIGMVAPTASIAGVSLEEVGAAVISLTKSGINTRRAMTYINMALSGIISPTEEARKAAKELGIDFSVAGLQANGFAGFMEEVAKKTGGSVEKIAELFPSVESRKAIFTLAGKGLEEFLTNADLMTGKTDKLIQKLQSNLGETFFSEAEDQIKELEDQEIDITLTPAIGDSRAIGETKGTTNLADGIKTLVNEAKVSDDDLKKLYNNLEDIAGQLGMSPEELANALSGLQAAAADSDVPLGGLLEVLGKVAESTGSTMKEVVTTILESEGDIEKITYSRIGQALAEQTKAAGFEIGAIVGAIGRLNTEPTVNMAHVTSALSLLSGTMKNEVDKAITNINAVNALDVKMSDAVNAIADLQKEITELDINKLFDVTKAFGDVNTGIDMSKMLEIVSAVKEKTGQGAQDILDAFRADDETQKLDYTWLLGNLETEVLAKFGTSKEAIRTTLFQIDDNLGNSLDFGAIASQLLAVKDTDAMIIAISAVQRKIAEVSNAGYDFTGIVESLQKLIDEGKLTSPINSIISAIEAVNTAGTGLTFQGFVSALKALSVSVNKPIGDVFDMLAGISKAPDGTDYSLYKTKLDEVAVGFKTTAGEIETAAKGIASAVVGPSGATKVVVEFAGLEEADKKAANDTLLFVSGLVDTANDLGVALSDVLGAVKDSFSEAGTITGAADSAASKMENTQKKIDTFNSAMKNAKANMGDALLSLQGVLSEWGTEIAKWVGSLSKGELAALGLSLALIGSGGVVSSIVAVVKIIGQLSSGMSIFSGTMTIVGAAIAGATVLLSLFKKHSEGAWIDTENLNAQLQKLKDISIDNLLNGLQTAIGKLRTAQQETQKWQADTSTLTSLVQAYNAALNSGSADADKIKGKIETLIDRNANLRDIIFEGVNGYEMQYEAILKNNEALRYQEKLRERELYSEYLKAQQTLSEYAAAKGDLEQAIANVSAAGIKSDNIVEDAKNFAKGLQEIRAMIYEAYKKDPKAIERSKAEKIPIEVDINREIDKGTVFNQLLQRDKEEIKKAAAELARLYPAFVKQIAGESQRGGLPYYMATEDFEDALPRLMEHMKSYDKMVDLFNKKYETLINVSDEMASLGQEIPIAQAVMEYAKSVLGESAANTANYYKARLVVEIERAMSAGAGLQDALRSVEPLIEEANKTVKLEIDKMFAQGIVSGSEKEALLDSLTINSADAERVYSETKQNLERTGMEALYRGQIEQVNSLVAYLRNSKNTLVGDIAATRAALEDGVMSFNDVLVAGSMLENTIGVYDALLVDLVRVGAQLSAISDSFPEAEEDAFYIAAQDALSSLSKTLEDQKRQLMSLSKDFGAVLENEAGKMREGISDEIEDIDDADVSRLEEMYANLRELNQDFQKMKASGEWENASEEQKENYKKLLEDTANELNAALDAVLKKLSSQQLSKRESVDVGVDFTIDSDYLEAASEAMRKLLAALDLSGDLEVVKELNLKIQNVAEETERLSEEYLTGIEAAMRERLEELKIEIELQKSEGQSSLNKGFADDFTKELWKQVAQSAEEYANEQLALPFERVMTAAVVKGLGGENAETQKTPKLFSDIADSVKAAGKSLADYHEFYRGIITDETQSLENKMIAWRSLGQIYSEMSRLSKEAGKDTDSYVKLEEFAKLNLELIEALGGYAYVYEQLKNISEVTTEESATEEEINSLNEERLRLLEAMISLREQILQLLDDEAVSTMANSAALKADLKETLALAQEARAGLQGLPAQTESVAGEKGAQLDNKTVESGLATTKEWNKELKEIAAQQEKISNESMKADKLAGIREETEEMKKLLSYYKSTGDTEKYNSSLSSLVNTLEGYQEEMIKAGEIGSEAWQLVTGELGQYKAELDATEAAEKEREKQLERQRKLLQKQADFMNTIISSIASEFSAFGEVGSLIGSILDTMKFTVEEMEDGTSRLVSPFEDLEMLSADIGMAIASWAIQEIGKRVAEVLAAFEKINELSQKTKWDLGMSNLAQTLKDFQEFESNQAKLNELRGARVGAAIADFFTLGLLGFGKKIDEQIAEIEEKLKATAASVATAMGVGVEDLASSMESALQANTYEEFVTGFADSLEDMTKRALIRAFLASDVAQSAMQGLSEAFVAALQDGVISAEELAGIQDASGTLQELMKTIWDALEKLGYAGAGMGEEWSGASAVKASLTEDTGNRIAGLLSTINLHAAGIHMILQNASNNSGELKVEVSNVQSFGGIAANEYLKALGW